MGTGHEQFAWGGKGETCPTAVGRGCVGAQWAVGTCPRGGAGGWPPSSPARVQGTGSSEEGERKAAVHPEMLRKRF